MNTKAEYNLTLEGTRSPIPFKSFEELYDYLEELSKDKTINLRHCMVFNKLTWNTNPASHVYATGRRNSLGF